MNYPTDDVPFVGPMTQRNPKLIDMEFTPVRERRGGNALDDAAVLHTVDGATSEIRSLMDQLQQTANEARHRLRAVEDERDSLSEQVESLQEQTRDLRGRAAEKGALGQQLELAERERDDLRRQLETNQQGQRGLEEASRQRDEARRQREEAAKSVEALHRSVAELNERLVAGQAQLLGVRQARDGIQNQNRELAQKLSQQEDVIADLEYRLEKHGAAALAETGRAGWEAEREELCRQVVELQTRLAGSTGDNEIARELETARTAQAAAELEEMKAAHDSAIAEAVALRAEVERLRHSHESAPTLEAMEGIRRERDAAQIQIQIATREVIELRAQIQTRAGEIEDLQRREREGAEARQELESRFQPLAEEREAAVRARDEMITSLASAQKQIDRIAKERDLLRDTGTQQTIALEKVVEEGVLNLEEVRREKGELTARLEAQRVETIELGTRLQSAQEQVRNLSASLAEVRLQARASARPAAAAPSPEKPAAAAAAGPPPAALFPSAETPGVVRTMRRCYQAYARDPDDLSHLNELHCAAHTFAEEAREGGCVAVHRLGLALASLLQELYHFPEQITSEVLTTVVQSIDFLTALLKVRELQQLKDPALGTVCVIDDDAATRECIILALEAAMVQILAFDEPSEALCGLATTRCDLIFLDVQMPGMDGFELCSQVRQHSLHQHTPVIFVTGQSGPDARSRAALCGGTDFLNKPFILAELALKALMVMIRSELHLAA